MAVAGSGAGLSAGQFTGWQAATVWSFYGVLACRAGGPRR